jgi:two-component system, NtrC family, sensor histidine kinase HydH
VSDVVEEEPRSRDLESPAPPPTSEAPRAPVSAKEDDTEALYRRLTRLMALRLVVLTLLLGLVAFVFLGSSSGITNFTALGTVALAYLLAAVYALFLRTKRRLRLVAYAQLVTDQLIWTILLYLTGGVTSGATSLYGLTCLTGAIVLARPGAATALLTALAAYGVLGVALLEGFVGPPAGQITAYPTRWADVSYPMLANVTALTVVTFLAAYLAERLRATGGDLVKATQRAEQAEKLALLGGLAAGLAHEIRNPLGSIAGSVELLRSSPALSDEEKRLCDLVTRETTRLNDLVGDMLDLARPRDPKIEKVNLSAIARDVATLASTSGRGSDVSVRYVGKRDVEVLADAAQLRQVVWNLVRNAVQASSAGDEVRITAKQSGGSATLEVADAGPGIAKEARAHLFDAFFTTRSQGTGVGLAVVKRIVDAHGFKVEVADVEEGTTFRVIIPSTAVRSA